MRSSRSDHLRSAPSARGVAVVRFDEHRLTANEVAHVDEAPVDLHERGVARVLGQPLGAADGGGAVLAAGAESALPVAPELAGLPLGAGCGRARLARAVEGLG